MFVDAHQDLGKQYTQPIYYFTLNVFTKYIINRIIGKDSIWPKYIDILIIYILTTTENVTEIFATLANVI